MVDKLFITFGNYSKYFMQTKPNQTFKIEVNINLGEVWYIRPLNLTSKFQILEGRG
jgi:hypothetical protein